MLKTLNRIITFHIHGQTACEINEATERARNGSMNTLRITRAEHYAIAHPAANTSLPVSRKFQEVSSVTIFTHEEHR